MEKRLASKRSARHKQRPDTRIAAQDIPLNGGGAKIRRRSLYPKSGAIVEETRSDLREGILRSQLTISPEGHLHIRCAGRTSSQLHFDPI
jgi:hypothetical protein